MRARGLLEVLLVAAAAAGAYANGLKAPPAFDDALGVLYNPRIEDPARLLRYAWDPADRTGQGFSLPNYGYRPMTEASFLVVRRIAGQDLAVQRAANLLLHLGASVLVLFIARTLALRLTTVAAWGPPAAGLFFALHPLGVEAVTYVYQRSTSLEALLGFGCLLCYLKGVRSAALLLAFLAALTKETAATLPLVLGFLEWILRRPGEPFRTVLARWLPFLGIALIVPIQVLRAMRGGGWDGLHPGLDPLRYLAAEGRVLWHYLRLHLLPLNLHFFYDPPIPEALGWASWVPAAGISALGAWAALGPSSLRWPRAALGLLLLPQALESSVFPIRDVAAEHRCYPGLLGGALLFGMLATRGKPFRILAALALLLMAAFTLKANAAWGDLDGLVHRDLRNAPRQGKLRAWLAWRSLEAGDKARAEQGFRTALTDPGGKPAILMTGHALSLEALGRGKEALETALAAVRRHPVEAKPLTEAIRLALAQGERQTAQDLASLAPRDPAPFRSAGLALARALLDLGRPREAEAVLRNTLTNAPKLPALFDNLGVALTRQGREAEAEAAFRRALELDPGLPEAHNDLGGLLALEGRPEEAEREVREALRLRPQYALARKNLAILLQAKEEHP